MDAQSVLATARRVHRIVQERRLSFVAAGLAYYGLVSVFPLGALALVVATTVGGEAVTDLVVANMGRLLSPTGARLIESALANAAGRGGVTVLGFAVLTWGSLKGLRGLDVAFSVVYGVPDPEPILGQVRDAAIAIVAVAVATGAVALVVALLTLIDLPLVGAFAPLGLAGVLTVLFVPIYYVFPDVSVTAREVLPGALLAGVGWTVLGAAFSVYATVARSADLYGVVGGVLLLVTWFYVASYLLLLGAALNAVLAGRTVATGSYNRAPDGAIGNESRRRRR